MLMSKVGLLHWFIFEMSNFECEVISPLSLAVFELIHEFEPSGRHVGI